MVYLMIRLKETRIKRGITQKRMAELLNISLSTYWRYEITGKQHREPKSKMVVKIVKVLDISADYLLGLKD